MVDRFAQNPGARVFLPLAEILKKYQLADESLEMLVQGVEKHPRYTAARMVLAQEYFLRGMMEEAWGILSSTVDPIKENLLAQRLSLKLAIVLGLEFEARSAADHMRRRGMFDNETQPLGDGLRVMDFRKLVQEYRARLQASGINLNEEPKEKQASEEAPPKPKAPNEYINQKYDEGFLNSMAGYHRMQLGDIGRLAFDTEELGQNFEGVELETASLAEIYERQGFLAKALKIYKRLSLKSPGSDYLLQKIALVQAKINSMAQSDRFRASEVAASDHMAAVELIDAKVNMLNNLLRAVDR